MMETQKIGNKLKYLALFTLFGTTQAHSNWNNENQEFEFGFRPRIAHMEDDPSGRTASALFRFQLKSQWQESFNTLIEVDHVELAWEDDFSNGVFFNNKPSIPDAGGTDLNQFLLNYSATNHLSFSIGREVIKFANQRFVGSNGFWQNEQSFDAAGFQYEFGTASSVQYRYLNKARRITGAQAGKNLSPSDSNFDAANGLRPAAFLGVHNHDTHLIHLDYKDLDNLKLSAYFYEINIVEAKTLSNRSFGASVEYKNNLDGLRIVSYAELALQKRTSTNSDSLIPYIHLQFELGKNAHNLAFHYEQLSSKNNVSFVTPLASLHDFNGWNDRFLITPASGLKDYSLRYLWRKSNWKVDVRYHLFKRDSDEQKLGNEIDVDFAYRFDRDNTLLLRVADVSSSNGFIQSEKRIMLQFSHNLRFL